MVALSCISLQMRSPRPLDGSRWKDARGHAGALRKSGALIMRQARRSGLVPWERRPLAAQDPHRLLLVGRGCIGDAAREAIEHVGMFWWLGRDAWAMRRRGRSGEAGAAALWRPMQR